MAYDGSTQPLISGSGKPAPQATSVHGQNRRRFRRVKSAPLAEFVPNEDKDSSLLPRNESIFGKLHPSLSKIAVFLGIYLGVGTTCFYLIRDDINGTKTNPILDALYFCVVSMTTVGYGDLVPDTSFAKILACFFVFIGMALVGLIMSKAADYLVEKQEILLVKALHMRQKLGPSDMLKEIETNKVKYKCYVALAILSVLMVVGIIFVSTVEDLDFIDAIYCVCSTITTLGYGDKSFSTRFGRTFAIIWILVSTLCLAQFLLYIAELFTETKQRALADWILTRRMTNVDLEAADMDNDGVVGAAEFVIYKLKEMGKISQEDVSMIMEEFEELDFDQSGTLSVSDLMLSQATETKK